MKKLVARVNFRNAENQKYFLRMFFREYPDTKLDIKDGEANFTITAENAFPDHVLLAIIECEIIEMHYDGETEAPAEPAESEESMEPDESTLLEKINAESEEPSDFEDVPAEPTETEEPSDFEDVPEEPAEPKESSDFEEAPEETAEPEKSSNFEETPAEPTKNEALADSSEVSAESAGHKPWNKRISNNAKRVRLPFVEDIAAESTSFREFLKKFNNQMIDLSSYASTIPFFWAKFTNALSVRCEDPTTLSRSFACETCESMNLNPSTYVISMAHAVKVVGNKFNIKTSFVPFFIEVLCYRNNWEDGREVFDFESDSEPVSKPAKSEKTKTKPKKVKSGYGKQKKKAPKINMGKVKRSEKIRMPKKGTEEQKRIALERAKQINVSKRCRVQLLENFAKTSANFGEFLRRIDNRLISYLTYVPTEEYAFARAVQLIADNCQSEEDIDSISGETITQAFNLVGVNGNNYKNKFSNCVKKEMHLQGLDKMTLIPFVMEVVSYKDNWGDGKSVTVHIPEPATTDHIIPQVFEECKEAATDSPLIQPIIRKSFTDEELTERFNAEFNAGNLKFICVPSNSALEKALLVVYKTVMRASKFDKVYCIQLFTTHFFNDCPNDIFTMIKEYCINAIYPGILTDTAVGDPWEAKLNIGNYIYKYYKRYNKSETPGTVTSSDYIEDLKRIMKNLEKLFNNK